MDGSRFCQRCYDEFMAAFNKKYGNDPSVVMDPKTIVHQCRIPKFTMSQTGRPIVLFWDCEQGRVIEFTQEEYVDKRNKGELP